MILIKEIYLDLLNFLGLILGSSWGAGINLYLTAAILGVAHRMHFLSLPGEMSSLANPIVIVIAVLLYAIEFFADKIPLVDSAWDAAHTFIRPVGGLALGYLATSELGPAIQYPVALFTGAVSLDSHLTKATARAAINTSPEPVTNSIASVTEDVGVVGVMYLIVKHPLIASLVVIVFIIFSIWFLKKMFKFFKGIFSKNKQGNEIKTKEEQQQ